MSPHTSGGDVQIHLLPMCSHVSSHKQWGNSKSIYFLHCCVDIFTSLVTTTMGIFTGRNEVVVKVIFLHLFVILFTGGVCLSACWDTTPLPGADTPPEQTPPEQTTPGADTTPPPGSRLRHTVNERPVRILLECILGSYVTMYLKANLLSMR